MADKSVLGIDLRVCSVKVIELRKDPNGNVVTSWGIDGVSYDLVDKHPEKEIAQAHAIQKIIADNHIRTKDAVFIVGGSDILVKCLLMPILPQNELREAIKWKIKDELAYPAEEATIDFIPLPNGTGAEKPYLISAARRVTVDRILEISHLANLNPISVVPVSLALIGVAQNLLLPKTVIALIYMGARTTTISFFKNGCLRFSREVPIGGEDITRAMTSILVGANGSVEIKADEAEKIKREYGVPTDAGNFPKVGDIPVEGLQALVRPALEKIQGEILRTIEYFKGQEGEVSIAKVYLTGGASSTPHMLEFLAAGLSLPLELLNPLTGIAVDAAIKNKEMLIKSAPQMSAALGAALINSGKSINLLPPEVKEKWRALLKKYVNFKSVAAALSVLLVLFYIALTYGAFRLKNEEAALSAKLSAIKPRLVRVEELERAMREVAGRRGVFKSIELSRIDIPRVLEDLSRNIPSPIIMDSISYNEAAKELRLKGIVFARGDAAENILSKFILDLSRAKSFKKVELIQAMKASGYIYEAFNFEIASIVKK